MIFFIDNNNKLEPLSCFCVDGLNRTFSIQNGGLIVMLEFCQADDSSGIHSLYDSISMNRL